MAHSVWTCWAFNFDSMGGFWRALCKRNVRSLLYNQFQLMCSGGLFSVNFQMKVFRAMDCFLRFAPGWWLFPWPFGLSVFLALPFVTGSALLSGRSLLVPRAFAPGVVFLGPSVWWCCCLRRVFLSFGFVFFLRFCRFCHFSAAWFICNVAVISMVRDSTPKGQNKTKRETVQL